MNIEKRKRHTDALNSRLPVRVMVRGKRRGQVAEDSSLDTSLDDPLYNGEEMEPKRLHLDDDEIKKEEPLD